MSNRTPEIIQHFVHAEACPWVLPALAKLGPRLGRDGFCGFEKRGRFIELKHVAGFEIEPGTNAYRNGDLAFGGKRCAHGLKVRQKRKELKEGVPEGWMQTVRSSATRRFCHPAGVRPPFGPVSGGVSTHRLISCDASGISRGSRREPDGCTNASAISGGAPVRFRVETARNF